MVRRVAKRKGEVRLEWIYYSRLQEARPSTEVSFDLDTSYIEVKGTTVYAVDEPEAW